MNELINKFNNNKQFRKEISKWQNMGEFKTTKHKKRSWVKLDPFKVMNIRKREKHHAITKFAEDMKLKASQAKEIIRDIESRDIKKLSEIEKDLTGRANIEPSDKIINRLNAVKENLSNFSKRESKTYSINNRTEHLLNDPGYCKKLQNCYGNLVQQNVHSEIVETLNDWSQVYYSNITLDNINNYSKLVVGSAKRAIEFKDERDYKEAYFFSDFCSGVIDVVKHGVLEVTGRAKETLGRLSEQCKGLVYACNYSEVVRTAGFFLQSCGYGLEDSGVDIVNCLKKAETALLDIDCEEIKLKVRDKRSDMAGWREGVGNVLQCASRALGDSAAILCSALAVACIAEVSLPVIAAGISVLAPPAISISAGGTVAVEQSVSVGESIAAAAARVAPLAGKLVESCVHFFGGRDKHPSTPVGRRGQKWNIVSKNVPTNINGRKFTGHAIDRMQKRGISPSVVEGVIKNGKQILGKTSETCVFIFKNLKVVVNKSGDVVMVSYLS